VGRDALMNKWSFGLTQHACEALGGRTILIPLALEKYNSKVIAQALCQVCNKNEFETAIDKTVAPSKGFYMTV
jgi:hypothetical protein